ncbi:MAG: isopenicillin N synthase family oxygenase [bacterium]|nr:isopenicillin N synthase family oxygenase [bacterium]
MTTRDIPATDVSALVARAEGREAAGAAIGRACREHGFFYAVGHGVPDVLQCSLEDFARRFFAQDVERKLAIRMERGGRAWRGYFPVGAEKTSGVADVKEGLCFGAEHALDHPRVRSGTPLYGPNSFPDVPGLRACVLEYMQRLTALGHVLMEGVAIGLGLGPGYFVEHGTRDPLTLFRIFHYPQLEEGEWIDAAPGSQSARERTHGEYVVSKVRQVFPELARKVLSPS